MIDLEIYEQDAEVFTAGELVAIHEFSSAVYESGLYDCFDSFDLRGMRSHEAEFGHDATLDMLRGYGGMLNTWYLAIDTLMSDILTCTSEFTRYSKAATRFIGVTVDEYHRTRQEFEHNVTVWSLAFLSEGADANYPPATRSVNYPMQCLSDE